MGRSVFRKHLPYPEPFDDNPDYKYTWCGRWVLTKYVGYESKVDCILCNRHLEKEKRLLQFLKSEEESNFSKS